MVGAVASYSVTVVSRVSTDTLPGQRPFACSSWQRKPPTFALSQDGTVATIVPEDTYYLTGARYVYIRHRDGSRLRLAVPAAALLAKTFRIHVGTNNVPAFQDVYFTSVRLTTNGMPVATVVSHFWGAYSGVETAAFAWEHGTWKLVPQRNVMPPDVVGRVVNTQVAAVETPSRGVFNGVYGGKWSLDIAYRDDPTYMLDQVELMDHNRVTALGIGTATAMNGTSVVGFEGGLNPFGLSCENKHPAFAVEWTGKDRRQLGRGIAYAVNAQGVVAGDDEQVLGGDRRPVIWKHGVTTLLGRGNGSAFAINDDGTVVGAVGGQAFVSSTRDIGHLRLLDQLTSDRTWSLTAAYAVNDAGEILAVGSRANVPPEVLLLSRR
jgi:hypothetical protein